MAQAGQGSAVSLHKKEMLWEALSVMRQERIKISVGFSLVCVFLKVFDQSALSTEAKEEMYKLYPNARRAHLKTGGNFPYLCRSAEVNLYVQVSPSSEARAR